MITIYPDPIEIFNSLMSEWLVANVAGDGDTMAGLYTDDCMFFGSKATLFRGRDGVAEYIRNFPRGTVSKVTYDHPAFLQLAPDVLAVGFYIDFHHASAGVLPWRATFTLKCEKDGKWRIAVHHAAPREPK